jgi:hypothetical protein
MTPKFRSGQTVHLSRSFTATSAPGGNYKVVRLLPDNGGEPQYRIKSEREPYERVAKESEMERA